METMILESPVEKIAFALGGDSLDANATTVELYDFDNSTGIIAGAQSLATVKTIIKHMFF